MDTAAEKAVDVGQAEEVKPLVLEIIPGHAAEGLIEIFQPGSYEGEPLRNLLDLALARKNLNIEEQLILEDISRQLDGGKLLCRGQEITGTALDFAVQEQTEAGEKYYYVPVRAIRPQEGGSLRPESWN